MANGEMAAPLEVMGVDAAAPAPATGDGAAPWTARPGRLSRRDLLWLAAALGVALLAYLAARVGGSVRCQSAVGVILILTLLYAGSTDRSAIDWRTVGWGLGLQFAIALVVLRTGVGQRVFERLGDGINSLLGFAGVGAAFVFGPLGDREVWPKIMTDVLGPQGGRFGAIFAFQVLPTLIFIAALSAVLYPCASCRRWSARSPGRCGASCARAAPSRSTSRPASSWA